MTMTVTTFLILVVSSLTVLCQGSDAGLRGSSSSTTSTSSSTEIKRYHHDGPEVQQRLRKLDLLENQYDAAQNVQCGQELQMDILCQGNCNFANQPGVCESKMFQYHGGPCREPSAPQSNSVLVSRRSAVSANADIEVDCEDHHEGPPVFQGQEVFIVVSDVKDPRKKSQMWTAVGEYFWTDYQDYPVGADGLSDEQNITIYSSEDTSYDNMLQTMIFTSPCQGTENFLDQLDRGQSVQLIGTAVDPTLNANFKLKIKTLTNKSWQLKRVSVATSATPPFAVVPLDETASQVAPGSPAIMPYTVQYNPFEDGDQLSLLATANAITATGLRCRVDAVYSWKNNNANIARANNNNNNNNNNRDP